MMLLFLPAGENMGWNLTPLEGETAQLPRCMVTVKAGFLRLGFILE